MKYASEDEVKKAIGIQTWRNLSKESIVKFAAMMPDMDKEVALKVIEKFPEFKAFALDALSQLEQFHKSTVRTNKQSQDQVHTAFQEVREALRSELDREDLSAEERYSIIERISATADREFEKDSENKQFLKGLFDSGAMVAAGAVILGVVFVGGKFLIGKDGDSASSE